MNTITREKKMEERNYIEKYGYRTQDVERLREAEADGLVAVEHEGEGIFCIWCHGLRGSVPEWEYVKDNTSKDIVFCQRVAGRWLV